MLYLFIYLPYKSTFNTEHYGLPNPPYQLSLWEETEVPAEKTHDRPQSVEKTLLGFGLATLEVKGE